MPVDPVIGTTLGVVGGLLGKIGQRRQQRRNIRDQTAANKELANFAYGKDLEQWERQNLYNAPTQQMARLREAGLNPNLVYGSGSAAGVTSPAKSPQYQTVRTDFSKRQSPLQALDMLGMYQDFKMKNAQIRRASAEADYAENFYMGRGGHAMEKMFEISRKRGIETGIPIWRDPEGRDIKLGRTPQFRKYQQQIKTMESGNELRRLEIAWFERLKAMGLLRGAFGLFR